MSVLIPLCSCGRKPTVHNLNRAVLPAVSPLFSCRALNNAEVGSLSIYLWVPLVCLIFFFFSVMDADLIARDRANLSRLMLDSDGLRGEEVVCVFFSMMRVLSCHA